MNINRLLNAVLASGGSIFGQPENPTKKIGKSGPSEVAHLSKQERKHRRRIRHASRRKRR